jgi:hypothetical protein
VREIKHTPGPWTNHGRITQPGLPHSAVAAETLIARVYSKCFGDTEQEIANANLIAAAPELLAIADEILNGRMLDEFNHDDDGLIDHAPSDETMRRWSTKLRAAIAKATGAA